MEKHKIIKSLSNIWKALVAVIKSLYKGMPFLMIVFTAIMFMLMEGVRNNSTLQLSLLTAVIFLSAIAVYFKSKNYGEAVLALSAGLFTIYTVEWSTSLVFSFIIVWIAFTVIVLLTTSVRLASLSETIYLEAVFALKSIQLDEKRCEKELRAVANSLPNSILGPIEKAEIIRVFAYKKLSYTEMVVALKWVNIYFALTRIPYLELADFCAIVIKRSSSVNMISKDKLFDYIYEGMRASSVSPKEYIECFNLTRHHLIKEENTILYFEILLSYFDSGESIANIGKYFENY